MAVAFDAKTSTFTDTTTTTLTISNLTVGSGSNRALLLELIWSTGTLPAGVTATWDSGGTNQAMTAITGASGADGGGTVALAMYGLVAPTSGTKNLVVSWTGSIECHAVAISFTGVDQTSVAVAFPHGTANVKTTSTASPCTVTITSAVGNMAVAAHIQHASLWGTVGPTILAQTDSGPAASAAGNYATGAASVTLTAAFTGTDIWGSVGSDVLASVAADPPVTNLMPQIMM